MYVVSTGVECSGLPTKQFGAADSARAVDLCAWSQAPILAHKPPSRALPLTEALGEI